MPNLTALLTQPDTLIAIVGATDTPGKFGGIIYRDLKAKGFKVVPVNPKRKTVANDQAYASLAELPERPSLVNFVVSPEDTLAVLQQCLDLELMNVWLQPGTANASVLQFLQAHRFNYLSACIMVATANFFRKKT